MFCQGLCPHTRGWCVGLACSLAPPQMPPSARPEDAHSLETSLSSVFPPPTPPSGQGEHPLSQMQMCLSITHTLYTHMQKHTNLHKHPSKHKYYMCMQRGTCTCMYACADRHTQSNRCISTSTRACAQAVPSGAVPTVGIKTPHDSCHTWNDYKSLGIE